MFWINTLINILTVVYVLDCIFMGLVIMMQRSKQEGLGAAFGGGFTESIWGAQTSNVLVKGTVWAAAIFFLLSITLARLYAYRENESIRMNTQPSSILQQLTQPSKPAPGVTPTNAAPVAPGTTNPAPASAAMPVTQPAVVPPVNATNSPATKPASK